MIRPAAAAMLGALILTGGCSMLTSFDDARQAEDSFQHCRDGSDNDNDGLVDCDDQGCVTFSFCKELTLAACSNGKDDDGDGFTDCQDKGCKVHESICSEKTLAACTNNEDDDNDGLVDCADPDCRSLKVCQEATDVACADKQDNDSDGLVDCLDYDCYDNRESCCKIDRPPFTGDDFTYKASCANSVCAGGGGCCSGAAASCCTGQYECAAFDPTRWVMWGWPRPRLENKAFVVNEPCGCDVSGLVSVEHLNLQPPLSLVKVIPKGAPVLSVSFSLKVPARAAQAEMICAGLTRTEDFPNQTLQCVGSSPPRLLAGVCLIADLRNAAPDAGPPVDAAGSADAAGPADARVGDAAGPADARVGDPMVNVLIDGQVMVSRKLTSGGPHSASLEVAQDGHITVSIGGVTYKSQTGIDPSLAHAKITIFGHGTESSLGKLVVKDEAAPSTRCRNPSAWLRHLALGSPVLRTYPKGGPPPALVAARKPSVMFNSQSGLLLMAFEGTAELKSAPTPDGGVGLAKTVDGIFWAKSQSGLTWEVHGYNLPSAAPEPVLQGSSQDLQVAAPDILRSKTLLHMWYSEQIAGTTGGWTIRHATSTDGIIWNPDTQSGAGLAPAPGTAWDSLAVTDPTVVERPGASGFYMWYTGTASLTGAQPSIGLAASPDGSTWTRVGKAPLISPLSGTGALACEDPEVIWDSKLFLYRMWYTHRAFGESPVIRYAVSTDGKSWLQWPKGPALSAGTPGSFDERGVRAPAAVVDEARTRLWYIGVDINSQLQLGYVENRGSM